MDRYEKLAAFLDVELGRLGCREVRLVEVTEERGAAFERRTDVLWCDAERSRRALFLLPNQSGDDATWLALQLICTSGESHRDA